LATHPPTPSSKSGLILIASVFAWSWGCPSPERFVIPYYHIIDNNTKGRILHYVVLNFVILTKIIKTTTTKESKFIIISKSYVLFVIRNLFTETSFIRPPFFKRINERFQVSTFLKYASFRCACFCNKKQRSSIHSGRLCFLSTPWKVLLSIPILSGHLPAISCFATRHQNLSPSTPSIVMVAITVFFVVMVILSTVLLWLL